jgi:hypothetical protein
MATNNQKANSINGNINQNIDSRNIFLCLNDQQGPLTENEVFDLLKLFMDNVTNPTSLMDTSTLPAKLDTKLIFNNAKRHKLIFENHSQDQELLNQVIEENVTNSESIIRSVKDIFIEIANLNDDGKPIVGDGDEQLNSIETKIYNIIVNDRKYSSNMYKNEKIKQFIIALLAYCVSKCQILINPEK